MCSDPGPSPESGIKFDFAGALSAETEDEEVEREEGGEAINEKLEERLDAVVCEVRGPRADEAW